MADSSRISTCSQGFLQEYQLNINFIDTLRQQSDKIQQMLALITQLKQDIKHKQQQINAFKSRQIDQRTNTLKVEQLIRHEYEEQLRILKRQIQQLAQERNELAVEVQKLKSKQPAMRQFEKIEQAYKWERDNQNNVIVGLKNELKRHKQIYDNCREENKILRAESDLLCKNITEMQFATKQLRLKYEREIEQRDHQIRKLQDKLQKQKVQKQRAAEKNIQLDQQLRALQKFIQQQLTVYEQQIKGAITEIDRAQVDGSIWRERYYELQQLVAHVESLRRTCKQNKHYFAEKDHQMLGDVRKNSRWWQTSDMTPITEKDSNIDESLNSEPLQTS